MGFTIRELENLSGIKAHTIRIWEQRYNFLKPSRTGTNIRTYNNEELKTLLTVSLLNKYGYKISEIDRMPASEWRRILKQLPGVDARYDYLVNDLIGYMIEFDMNAFEDLLNENIRSNGIEIVLKEILFRFLDKIGLLWQTGNINPAHEHLVSNIIRQKIIAAIEQLPNVTSDAKLVVLFLPEDEHHELGLLYVWYMMKRKGLRTIYLGANVPLKDVVYVSNLKNPSFLYIHLTAITKVNLPRFANLLLKETAAPVYLSGRPAVSIKKLPADLRLLASLSEVSAFISAL